MPALGLGPGPGPVPEPVLVPGDVAAWPFVGPLTGRRAGVVPENVCISNEEERESDETPH